MNNLFCILTLTEGTANSIYVKVTMITMYYMYNLWSALQVHAVPDFDVVKVSIDQSKIDAK